MPNDLGSLCLKVAETIKDTKFPGAIIPSHNTTDGLNIFVLTNNETEWRVIRSTILAFSGPTVTSFKGVPRNKIFSEDPLRPVLDTFDLSVKTILPDSKGFEFTNVNVKLAYTVGYLA